MKDPQKLWKDLILRFKEQSRCKSRQVGAIIVKDEHLLAEGWNSAAQGSVVDDCPRSRCHGAKCEPGTNLDQAICVHAEVNAIGQCAKEGRSTKNACLYSTTYPCAECAKLIVTSGITSVGYLEPYNSPLSDLIFKHAGVKTFQIEG